MEISTVEGTLESGMENHINGNGNLEVTAIQLVASIGSSGEEGSQDSAALQKMSRAEERRREVERKRAEKRELERRKREEEKRRLQLQVNNSSICNIL
jgi:sensor histidine kinase YesM